MRNYDRAIGFFDRVLTNGYYHKDQDAQIKKGYSYFSTKRFDLAAREFQNYLRQFPNGRYSHIASEWKQMSTRELLYRIEAQRIPDVRPATGSVPKTERENAPAGPMTKPRAAASTTKRFRGWKASE
jgi:tetratricopeptide (TPR) repeat protein